MRVLGPLSGPTLRYPEPDEPDDDDRPFEGLPDEEQRERVNAMSASDLRALVWELLDANTDLQRQINCAARRATNGVLA